MAGDENGSGNSKSDYHVGQCSHEDQLITMAVWRVLILSAVTAYLVYAKAPTELPGDGVYRKLAGKPSEFPYFRSPSPEDASISSDVITHVVAEISDANKHWEHVFTVDECQILTLTMIYHNPEIVLSAKDPTGEVVSPDFSVEEGFGINTGDMYPSRSIAFRSPKSGTWSVVLDWETSSTGWAYAYIIASVSGARSQLWATVESENLLVGSTVGLQAKMVVNPLGRDGDAFIAIKDYVKEADLMVTLPDGSKIYEPMTDSSDNVNDDMYKASFHASEAGVYNARIDFEGVHADTGEAFSRSLFYLFQVVEPSIKLTDEPAIAQMRRHSMMDVDVIHMYIPVEWDHGQQTVFRGFTQVWGTADSGEVVPVAWLSGLMPIEPSNQFNSTQHFLRFDLDGRWLELANAGLPLYLRNTNFDDIKAFVTLTSMDNIKVTTTDQELLRRKWKPRSPNDITFEMKNGYNPHLYLRQNSSEEPGKLILIHGYCAKETPFDLEEFTDYKIFEDFSKNRLNDEFALLIKDYVENEGISKFSLVSHSQGGFAALHLYTYYATGIDNTVCDMYPHLGLRSCDKSQTSSTV